MTSWFFGTIPMRSADVIERLQRIEARARDPEFWRPFFLDSLQPTRTLLQRVSPVVTGSYRASHTIKIEGLEAKLHVDPMARNTASGVLVTSYSGYCENRYGVYAQGSELLDARLDESMRAQAHRLLE